MSDPNIHGGSRVAEPMTKFNQMRKRLMEEWGLTLERSSASNRGWWNGCWRTGYIVTGMFPGAKPTSRRYKSLNEISTAMANTNA